MRGLVTRAGRVRAKFAGTLQIDGLGVKQATQRHHAIHFEEGLGILGKSGQRPGGPTLCVKQLLVGNGKLGNCPQISLPWAVLTYGVDWNKVFGSAGGANGIYGTNALASGSVTAGPVDPGFFFSLANKNIQLFLEARSTRNRVRTLSTPKLLAMENQEAKAVIGKSTGYRVTTTINQVTTESIQFLESGVILKVTPSVDEQGRVHLRVHPEVSSTTLIAGIPEKKSTEVTTELMCEDGQSVFIGGLMKNTSSSDRTAVPILGNLPGIGRLFSSNAANTNKTETVVIITPRIVRNPGSTDPVSGQTLGQIDHNLALIQEQERKLRSLSLIDKLDTSDPH
jgi:type II secretory pathway component GspD/PulD (secretin)